MTDISAFAQALIAAHHSGTRVAPEAPLPQTPEEAYAVQEAVLAATGPVAGFKVGLKPDAAPIFGAIRAAFTQESGSTIAVADQMGIELEVGWLITAPLPAPEAEDFDAALRRAVVPVPVIELVDTRVTGPAASDPMVKLADFQVNHGLICGTPRHDWDGRDFGAVTARLSAGVHADYAGATEVPGGSALSTLAALIRTLNGACGGLKVGQVVITGTLFPMFLAPGGTDISGTIEGLGTVTLHLS